MDTYHKPHIDGRANMSFEEAEFRETALFLSFDVPHNLKNWKQYFIDEQRFLIAANIWLEAKCDGVRFPRVEDDVDKKLMKWRSPGSSAPSSYPKINSPQYKDWSGWDDDYYPNANPWWHAMQPIKEIVLAISKPSGLSGVDMATVF